MSVRSLIFSEVARRCTSYTSKSCSVAEASRARTPDRDRHTDLLQRQGLDGHIIRFWVTHLLERENAPRSTFMVSPGAPRPAASALLSCSELLRRLGIHHLLCCYKYPVLYMLVEFCCFVYLTWQNGPMWEPQL